MNFINIMLSDAVAQLQSSLPPNLGLYLFVGGIIADAAIIYYIANSMTKRTKRMS